MQTPQEPVRPTAAASSAVQPAQVQPRGWTVKFLVPPPQTMPTERLKARAELVRSALSCFNCSSY